MRNGFIYVITKYAVRLGYYTNLVELFKWIFGCLTKDSKRTYKNFAIDIFIILKWVFVLGIWIKGYNSSLLTIFTLYLIWTNLFTYFYYHFWNAKRIEEIEHGQRRFINLVIAFSFSNICFAYLYSLPYKENFIMDKGFESKFSFLMYSSFNSLFSDYNFISSADQIGSILTATQLTITFVFVSILLTKTIPE
ncbi:hypothetical protein [Salibacter halophilus]|uniref:Uncharacterized protein n=1 Tax=Salibacter halophilus TaxID=1803916 RepID=A0A6N6M3S9_9FLAO|nr:hypothetical protein [Salibacter halophilus]KAB1063940.1 hypothetical protein F3059_07845 [Salibacter halophilus]